jgi:hypothetical protein
VPTIQHSAIPDGQRHEPKGISTASNGQVYVANGAASGSWQTLRGVVEFNVALTPSGVSANSVAEQSFTVSGLLTTDKLLQVIKPTLTTHIGIVNFRIISNNTLGITYVNTGGGTATPAAETYSVLVWR